MKVTELLLFAVVGWCSVGTVGIVISIVRGQRAVVAKHAASIAAVAGVYLLTLLVVSMVQQQRTVPVGQDQCFGQMCFAVTTVDEVPGLVVGDEGRVVRVTIRVTNRGAAAQAEESIEAYLIDSRGRVSKPLAGLSGNRLDGRVAAKGEMVGQPMYRVEKDSHGLGLVLTHGNWQWRRLVLGDSDSLGHRPTVVGLGR